MKWENFGAFLSRLVRRKIFLTGFFLSEFHCTSVVIPCYSISEQNHSVEGYFKTDHVGLNKYPLTFLVKAKTNGV
jgi:hypothetical protein